ncbi:MAG: glycoside hydrolase family 97 protein [Prevotellaceae bacterium]|nr:glycoside hydrolase family 97 protein [Prevotellaceae bacterium]
MMKRHIFMAVALWLCCVAAMGKTLTLSSPDGRLKAEVRDGLVYSLWCDGKQLMQDCRMGLNIEGEEPLGKIGGSKAGKVTQSVDAPMYRQKHVDAECNTLTLGLGSGVSLELRAYDQGIAYRFVTKRKQDYTVESETAEFNFTDDYTAYLPYTTNEERPLAMAFQATYGEAPLSQSRDLPAFLPATVDCGVAKVTLMEADLEAYPGMFLTAEGTTLKGLFAQYPKETGYWPWRKQLYVTEAMPYIAKCQGTRTLPWRIIAVSHEDREMPVNDLVYLLAAENRIGDTSWIQPGKVAWDWWNDWGLEHVSFKAGINTETYKYYIDFAARYGLEYIILDEGWYVPSSGDMLTVVPDVDLPEIVRYGQEKGVGVVLWTVFNVLDDQLEEACARYSQMGVKGFKVDFLDRDDQTAVEMAYRIAAKCAEYHLILDYHGIYKPTGINRTYPNIVNFESVFGMEEAKWTEHDAQDMPEYDVSFPFIRMQSGYVDFTPGGMRNATKADFQPVYYNPMTMGTRCHQAAMYVVHDSPFTMLADSPSAYEKEPDYTSFIAAIPTVWDETIVPQGKLGEYIVTARRLGNDWYVAGQTNWEGRELTLSFDFLGDGEYEADMLSDGINADKAATDYQRDRRALRKGDTMQVRLSSGGGFVMTIKKQ